MKTKQAKTVQTARTIRRNIGKRLLRKQIRKISRNL